MKVMFIATYSGVAGASYSLISLIKYLREKNVDSIVILPRKGKLENLLIEEKIQYKIIRLFNWVTPITNESTVEKAKWKFKKIINFLQEYRILSIIKKNNIDLIHINAITASWGYKSAKKSGIPVVWHIREFLEEDLNKRFRDKERSIEYLNKADAVIAISESVKNKYKNIISNENLIRIYNGVDLKNYNIKNEIFTRDLITMTLAGRIVPSKGHEEVVLAVNELVSKGIRNIKVQFVGVEGDRSFVGRLKSIINKLDLIDYIEFKGHTNQMQKLWSETDIALICSKAEAFGRVTIEAMMAGSLVIGADTKGTAELIDNKYGLTYKQGNHISLAEKIAYAINNKNEMILIAKEAKHYANNNFTAENNAKKIYSVYERIL